MRIALLTESGPTFEQGVSSSDLSIAGMTLSERQLHLAVALGCERVICVAPEPGGNCKHLRQDAERAGVKFHVAKGPHELLGLVSANDELLVVTERLLFDEQLAVAALAKGNCVLVLPVEAGTAAGFERIDLNRAWAGLLWMPGHLVQRISQLPADCDAPAALLRIALQGHVPDRSLPASVLADHRWTLVQSREQLSRIEHEWFQRRLSSPARYAPGRVLAALATRGLIPHMLERGWSPQTVKAAGVLSAAVGLAAAANGFPVLGLAAICLGWLLIETGTTLASVRTLGLAPQASRSRFLDWRWPMDICLVAAAAFSLAGSWPDRIFAPGVMVAFIRLAEALADAGFAELARDRILLSGLLVLAAATGMLLPAVQAICAVWVAVLFFSIRQDSRLTLP